MESKKYRLRVLPMFEQDLNSILDYVAVQLGNPVAAESLLNAVEKAVYERLNCAEAFEQFQSANEREHPYYRISVKNYTVFYVVIDDVIELRRILYSRRDWAQMM